MSDLHQTDQKVTNLGQDAPKVIGDYTEPTESASTTPTPNAHTEPTKTQKHRSPKLLNKVANKWTGLAAIALIFGGIGSYMLFGSKAAVLPNGDLFFGQYSLSKDGQDVTWNSQLPQSTSENITTLYSNRQGSAVAYYNKTAKQLTILDRITGEKTAAASLPITINENSGDMPIRWSGDGTRILTQLYSAPQGTAEVYTFTIATGGWKKLNVQDPYNFFNARWASDDSKLIYASGTSSTAKKLCSLPIDTNSVAGTESCEDWTVWNDLAASLKPTNLSADKVFNIQPNISSIAPNGAGMTVVAYGSICPVAGGACDPGGVTAAYSYDLMSKKFTQLFKSTDGSHLLNAALWSPDSSTIALIKSGSVTFVKPDGTAERTIVASGGGLNSEWTSYVATPPRTSPLTTGAAIQHKNGAILPANQLAPNVEGYQQDMLRDAVVSPVDGNSFVYIPLRPQVQTGTTYSYTTPAELRLMPTLGGASKQIIKLPLQEASWRAQGWSPDGNWILLSSSRFVYPNHYNELWLVRPDGTSLTRLGALSWVLSSYSTTYTWGSDSRSLYFTYDSRNNGVLLNSTNLCRINLDNTTPICRPIQGLDTAYSVSVDQRAMSPDGKTLLAKAYQYTDGNGMPTTSLLYMIDIATATVRGRISPPAGTGQIGLYQWAPDGTKIAFSTYPVPNQANTTAGLFLVNPDGMGFAKNGSGIDWTYGFIWQGVATYAFNSVSPLRVADTRTNSGMPYAGKTMKPAAELAIKVAGNDRVPATAKAVVVNIVAVNSSTNNYLTVYPTGSTRPDTSVVNLKTGETRNNQSTVGVGTGGQITVYNSYGTADLVMDVVGYYDNTGSYLNLSNPPKRLADTRLTPNSTKTLTVNPTDFAGKTGAELNLTIVQPAQAGHLITFPAGEAVPTSSSLNYVKGEVLAKASTTKVSTGGVSIENFLPFSPQANLVVDLTGTYSTTAGLSFAPIVPQRIADTRAASGKPYAGKPIGQNGVLKVQLPANAPTGVKGVVVNLTVPSTTAIDGSFLTLYRSDISRPTTSNINFTKASVVAFNQATVAVDDTRSFSVFNAYGTSDVIIDVMGYYY